MSAASSPLAAASARANYRVYATDVSKVVCHRQRYGEEQYLVIWKTAGTGLLTPPGAAASWHSVAELERSLHHVQTYIEGLSPRAPALRSASVESGVGAPSDLNRKRKAPGADPVTNVNGIASRSERRSTPKDSAYFSREASVASFPSNNSSDDPTEPLVYNAVLQKREGRLIARKLKEMKDVAKINAATLPTKAMQEAAANARTAQAEEAIRIAFDKQLKQIPLSRWENLIDMSAPSLNFTFIDKSILRDGVEKLSDDFLEGCTKPCKPNMGQHIGCEYPRLCKCLEYAAVNETELERENPERYAQYLEEKQGGYFINTEGLPKRFPYQKPNKTNPNLPTILQTFYLDQRYPIYECNPKCNCGYICKSRVVQKGRKVPLVIFKTATRGWGVFCDEDLVRGEFIDTYVGEIITNDEADRREERAGAEKNSYLYALDKFVGDDPSLTEETCYIVDGQYMGNVTRFINHSCEPNCRQYTVSYNKHDLRIYDLAFFAVQDIPAGTELTFDYADLDEEEEDVVRRKREAAEMDPRYANEKRCNCGARKCRGFLWMGKGEAEQLEDDHERAS